MSLRRGISPLIVRSKPKVLVVGGRGFLGRHIMSDITRMKWESVSIDSRSIAPEPYLQDVADGRFSSVIVVAAQKFHEPEFQVVAKYLHTNSLLPAKIASACATSNTELALIGTRWSLGEFGEGPNSLYAATKLLGEVSSMRILANSKVPMTVIRVRDLVGPGDPRNNLFRLLHDAVRSGKTLPLTPGYQLIDPIDVRDTSASIVSFLALRDRKAGIQQYEIGLRPETVRRIVMQWLDIHGVCADLDWAALPNRGTELFKMKQVHPNLPTFMPRARVETLRDIGFS